jgi:hypothetical protein
MCFYRYTQHVNIGTDLDHFDDILDWLEGLKSSARLREVIREGRGLAADEAIQRARRGTYYAGIAADFINAARVGEPHVAFLPAYYAVLNLAKLVIACSDRSSDVDGGIYHGVAYRVDQKNSKGLFTESLDIHRSGVFPLLYEVLVGHRVRMRKGKNTRSVIRRIPLRRVYERLTDVGAEYARCDGFTARFRCEFETFDVERVAGSATSSFVLAGRITCADGTAIDEQLRLPPFPNWERDPSNSMRWRSPAQEVPNADLFDAEAVIDRRHFGCPRNPGDETGRFLLPSGRLMFTDELAIFLALFHLSSIIRYKPRFLDTIQDSAAWPVVLASRRRLLYRATVLALANVFQRNFVIG